MNRARMTFVAVLSLVLSLAVAFAAYRILEARANPTAARGASSWPPARCR